MRVQVPATPGQTVGASYEVPEGLHGYELHSIYAEATTAALPDTPLLRIRNKSLQTVYLGSFAGQIGAASTDRLFAGADVATTQATTNQYQSLGMPIIVLSEGDRVECVGQQATTTWAAVMLVIEPGVASLGLS